MTVHILYHQDEHMLLEDIFQYICYYIRKEKAKLGILLKYMT